MQLRTHDGLGSRTVGSAPLSGSALLVPPPLLVAGLGRILHAHNARLRRLTACSMVIDTAIEFGWL